MTSAPASAAARNAAAARGCSARPIAAGARRGAAADAAGIARALGALGTRRGVAIQLTGLRRLPAVPSAVVVLLPAVALLAVDVAVVADINIAAAAPADRGRTA